MVNDITKKIILIMTVVVIGVMAYLVNSPKFLSAAKDGKLTLKAKIAGQFKSTKIAKKNRNKKPDIGNKSLDKRLPDIGNKKVRIAISLPLSGEGAIIGNAIKHSLEMAKADLPKDTKFQYEIVVDDSSKEKTSSESINKLFDSYKPDAVLSLGSKDAKIVANIAEKRNVPHITCAYGKEIAKNNEYTINHFPSPKAKADGFLQNLSDNNLRIFSIVASDTPEISEIIDAVELSARIQNFPIKNNIKIEHGKKDFSKEVAEINNENPEAVMVMLDSEDLELFAGALNESGNKYTYTSIDMLHYFYNRELVEGAIFVIASDGDYEFKESFRKKSVLQIPLCAAQLYDAVNLLASAYESTDGDNNKPKVEKVMQSLREIKSFPSATGIDISVSQDGNIDTPMIGMKVEKGLLKYQ